MKQNLIALIDSLDDIEKLFYTSGGVGIVPVFEKIYDVQKFQDWLMEIKLELEDIHDRTKDKYIWETTVLCGQRLNGHNDRKFFSGLKGRLNAIRKNIDKYYPKGMDNEKEVGRTMDKEKPPLIFISHSSKNKKQVELLIELLKKLYLVPKRDLFCSSVPGCDIPVGENIFDFLRDRFLKNNIHVICMHSKDYYESPVSLNEMGAAWVLRTKVSSILLPGFDIDEMKGVINGQDIAIKLDNDKKEVKDKINQLKDILSEEFQLPQIPSVDWETARDRFIEDINSEEINTIYKSESSTDRGAKIIELLKKIAATQEGILMTPADTTNGISIQIGNEVLASEYNNRREYAKWDEALKACIALKYIEKKNKDIYATTNAGYRIVESAQ